MNELIYDKPARCWKQALPLGNGLLGFMVYGGAKTETLTVNDGTLWSGYPKQQDNPESLQNLAEVRRLIFEGKNAEADKLAESKLCGDYSEAYLPLGKIEIAFSRGGRDGYSRRLDLNTAIHTVKTKQALRESFVSYPRKIGVYHIETHEKTSFCVNISCKWKSAIFTDDALNLLGNAPDYVAPNYLFSEKKPIRYDQNKGMAFCLRIAVETDGEYCFEGKTLRVNNATTTSLYIATATGFCGYDSFPVTDAGSCLDDCKRRLTDLNGCYAQIREEHIADYRGIYDRQAVELSTETAPTTDRLVRSARRGKIKGALVQLLYNFGKYLMIAGSREGGQALTLQGLWNDNPRPPWSCNYTININTQMNYWCASQINAPESLEPFLKMVYEVMQRGKSTARVNYGCGGFSCNHNVDIWRKTAPVKGDPSYMLAPLCGVWLSNEVFEHLSYGLLEDKRAEVLEIATEAARFVMDFLTERDGYLVICPSPSPENVFFKDSQRCKLDYASAFDMSLVRQCLVNYLSFADREEAKRARDCLDRLYPMQYCSDGICEWHEQYAVPEVGHRHFSPLYGFYPARTIGYFSDHDRTEQVRKLFHRRLDNWKHYYGWSGAWAICLAARLHEPKTVDRVIRSLLSHSLFSNLFDMHPPFLFQIDGNFGFVAGINEALVSVNDGVIELLPALPDIIPCGSVSGMRTANGYEVSFAWKDGIVTSATVRGEDIVCLRKNDRLSPDLKKDGFDILESY